MTAWFTDRGVGHVPSDIQTLRAPRPGAKSPRKRDLHQCARFVTDVSRDAPSPPGWFPSLLVTNRRLRALRRLSAIAVARGSFGNRDRPPRPETASPYGHRLLSRATSAAIHLADGHRLHLPREERPPCSPFARSSAGRSGSRGSRSARGPWRRDRPRAGRRLDPRPHARARSLLHC